MAYYPDIKTLGDVARYHARHRPHDIALVFEGRITDYTQWNHQCSQVANGLIALGCRPLSRIGFMGKNSDHFFDVLFGGAKAGAILVPVSWRLAPREIEYIVKDAELEVLFVDEEFVDKIEAVRTQLVSLKEIVLMTGRSKDYASFISWRDGQSSTDPGTLCAPEDVALQLYTSGTTGHPKGVQLPHKNFYVLAEALSSGPNPNDPLWEWNVWGPEDSSLITMPCFHISGTGWGIVGLYNGARNVVLGEFDAEAVLDAVAEHKITKMILVPTAIQMVVQHPKAKDVDFSSLKYLCYGASPIPLDLLKDAIKTFNCGFIQMYGLTETSGAVTFLPAEDHEINGNDRMRSAGRAIHGVEIQIVDVAGKEVACGQTGEICIRSETAMKGYWKLPDETATIITPDGWVRSGDAGYMNDDGYIFLQDRVKDMIVSGGMNIYPAEIESALFAYPDIAEIAVIGVPHDKWGEAVKALIVPKPGTHPTEADVLAFAREQIADFKVPKSVEFVDTLPRNASGKVLKRELRKKYWEGQNRQIN